MHKMKHIKLFEDWLNEVELPKGRFIEMASRDAADYADAIIDLINQAYSHKGGNLKIRNANDVRNGDVTYWILKDINDDPEPEIAIGGYATDKGIKMTVMGQDGSAEAKKDAKTKMVELMKTRGFYAEMDKDLAQKLGLAPLRDENRVREVLQKEIDWHNDGSYTRDIAGGKHVKVLVGIPE
jgi:hypothetical protein